MGIDIKDIPNINDHEFSVTLNAFFVVRSVHRRLINRELSIVFKDVYDSIREMPLASASPLPGNPN